VSELNPRVPPPPASTQWSTSLPHPRSGRSSHDPHPTLPLLLRLSRGTLLQATWLDYDRLMVGYCRPAEGSKVFRLPRLFSKSTTKKTKIGSLWYSTAMGRHLLHSAKERHSLLACLIDSIAFGSAGLFAATSHKLMSAGRASANQLSEMGTGRLSPPLTPPLSSLLCYQRPLSMSPTSGLDVQQHGSATHSRN
jgi:hypothetical protein